MLSIDYLVALYELTVFFLFDLRKSVDAKLFGVFPST